MRSAAASVLGSEVASATLANVQAIRQNRNGSAFMVGEERGEGSPPIVSGDQGSDQAVALADLSGEDVPGAALAVAGTDGIQGALTLQIDHNGVDGALVASRVHAHAAHQVATGLRTLLNQDAADSDAGEKVKVHRSGVVN